MSEIRAAHAVCGLCPGSRELSHHPAPALSSVLTLLFHTGPSFLDPDASTDGFPTVVNLEGSYLGIGLSSHWEVQGIGEGTLLTPTACTDP